MMAVSVTHNPKLIAGQAVATKKKLLRFLACGSLGDSKSSLIQCLVLDCKQLVGDQLAALSEDSPRPGTPGAGLHSPALGNSFQSERHAGGTIDVAYQYFATASREFIVADAPGHERYTRNVVTAASTAEFAVLAIDARHGLLPQTRHHSHLVTLLGIRDLIVLVNNMDTLDWDRAAFERVRSECLDFAAALGLANVICIPASALHGDNVTRRSEAMPWYNGPTLIEQLERVEISADAANKPFRMPVQ